MKKSTIVWGVAGVFMMGTSALGGTAGFNIDFGGGEGIPSPSYGAATGQVGPWNRIESNPFFTSFPLFNVNGELSSARLVCDEFTAMGTFHVPSASTTGEAGMLLDDYLLMLGDFHAEFRFEGLANGMYDLTLYGIQIDFPDEPSAFTWISDDLSEYQDDITGDEMYTGDWVESVTHTTFRVPVTDGTLSFYGGGVFFPPGGIESFGALNGIQLAPVPTPGGAALMGVAGLAAVRRRR